MLGLSLEALTFLYVVIGIMTGLTGVAVMLQSGDIAG